MKEEEVERYRKASEAGTIPDDRNPLYIFQSTNADMLIRFIHSEFSFEAMARRELAARGLGLKGEWIGFEAAKRLWSLPRPGLRRPRNPCDDNNIFQVKSMR